MSFIFYIFAALLIYFSLKSFLGGIDYLNCFKKELAKPRSEYTPFASIIAPCKGIDEGLETNLAALLEQDYAAYEIVFVVDNENDQAVSVINELISRKAAKSQSEDTGGDGIIKGPVEESTQLFASSRLFGKIPLRIVVAARSINSSQKVENLREAVLHADPRSEIFAFVDSDARPASNWLRTLIAPLENETIGAATGYRWFVPEKPTLAAELRSAWNASIASALGPNTKSNFCWGGSTAIRRDTFEKLNIRNRWKGTLSDDFTLTRAIKEAGLAIHFVPQALTPSHESCTFPELLEFTTRQLKITRVYAPHLWLVSFFGSGLFTLVMASAFLIAAAGRSNEFSFWAAIATLAIVSILSIGKSWLRIKAVGMVIPPAKSQMFPQLMLWALTPPLFLFNCVSALFSKNLIWRGTRYRLVSEKETRRID